jgi:hypothetical protein
MMLHASTSHASGPWIYTAVEGAQAGWAMAGLAGGANQWCLCLKWCPAGLSGLLRPPCLQQSLSGTAALRPYPDCCACLASPAVCCIGPACRAQLILVLQLLLHVRHSPRMRHSGKLVVTGTGMAARAAGCACH